MDPSRKRKIRLVVALTAAVLLASALIYTSFSASSEAKSPSQLMAGAQPGQSYQLTGKVANGSVRHEGSALFFRVRDRTAHLVLAGSAEELLRTVAAYGVENIETHEADLTEVFLGYYRREEEPWPVA